MCRILLFSEAPKKSEQKNKKKPQKNVLQNLEKRYKTLLKMQLSNQKEKCLLALHTCGSYLHSWGHRKQNNIKKTRGLI